MFLSFFCCSNSLSTSAIVVVVLSVATSHVLLLLLLLWVCGSCVIFDTLSFCFVFLLFFTPAAVGLVTCGIMDRCVPVDAVLVVELGSHAYERVR